MPHTTPRYALGEGSQEAGKGGGPSESLINITRPFQEFHVDKIYVENLYVMVLWAHAFHGPQLTAPSCSSLISSVSLYRSPHFISLLPCFFPSPFLLLFASPAHFFSSYPSFLICLLPPLCPSPLRTAPARCLAFPLMSPCPPRSAQPACAVRAVGRLQARTGTSSGREITASAPGAPSSMRKVGTWQGTGAPGATGEWARFLDKQLEQILFSSGFLLSSNYGAFPSTQSTLPLRAMGVEGVEPTLVVVPEMPPGTSSLH